MLGNVCSIIFLCVLLAGCVSPVDVKPLSGNLKPKRIAVIAIPNRNMPSAQVENVAMERLYDKGYVISSRSDFDRVLREQKIQANQLTEKKAARIGRILNVDAILILEMTSFSQSRTNNGGTYIARLSLAARLIDVEKAQLIWIVNEKKRQEGIVEVLVGLPMTILAGSENDIFESMTSKMLSKFPSAT